MNVSRQPLLLPLLLKDLVTIPGLFDCNLYKCKDTFPTFLAQMVPKLRYGTRMIAFVKDILLVWLLYCNTL